MAGIGRGSESESESESAVAAGLGLAASLACAWMNLDQQSGGDSGKGSEFPRTTEPAEKNTSFLLKFPKNRFAENFGQQAHRYVA